jgi:hypothetical protein
MGLCSGWISVSPWRQELETAVDQQGPEDVDDPVEAVDESNAGQDKDAAHDQGADNSPKQHFVLVMGGNFEVTEDHKKDEQVVDTERELDDVSVMNSSEEVRPCQ